MAQTPTSPLVPRSPRERDHPARRHALLTAVAAATGLVALAGCGRGDTAANNVPAAVSPSVTTAAPASSGAAEPTLGAAPPSAPAPANRLPATTSPPAASQTAAPSTLHPGDRGAQVLALQKQLSTAGYWLGTADGTYGLLTQQAVLAVQKAAGLSPDGVAGEATLRALAAGTRPTARSHRGLVVEVDLSHQLVLIVRDGAVEKAFNTSTGSGRYYVSGGTEEVAVTTKGTWEIFRQVDGVDHGPLGDLYRPKYFHAGIALHGYPSVPAHPASHGCVRLSNAAMDWLWSSGAAEIGTTVLVY